MTTQTKVSAPSTPSTNLKAAITASKIESGIECPPTAMGRNGTAHPFKQMEVGDSMLLPLTVDRGNLSASCAYWRKKLGYQFAVRTRYQERDGESGWRVWRLA
jgi:hypothetical protein